MFNNFLKKLYLL